MNKFLQLFLVLSCFSCAQKPTEKASRVDNLPYYNTADFTPYWLAPDSDSLADFHQIPSFSLINQNGDSFSEADVQNKIYITDFFFTTCPGICAKMTNSMAILQDTFLTDNNVILLSHSVTPDKDSVPVLQQYASKYGVVSGKWHLLTGDRKQLYALGRKAYFVEEDLGVEKTDDDFLHTENFVLIDKNRHIRGIYNGLNKTAIQQLIADVKTLEKEM